MNNRKVDNAIILAAGMGARFVPLTYTVPKSLIKVNGEVMTERLILQLKEKNIDDITVVVGYLKDEFKYLEDKYNVKIIYNEEYATKNNLASLYCVKEYLKNTYVLCADNYIKENIFSEEESNSWFSTLYFEGETAEWCVKLDADERINKITIGGQDSLAVVGPSFFNEEFSKKFTKYLKEYYERKGTEDYYWEQILHDYIDELPMYSNEQTGNLFEFDSLEELREFDKSYQENIDSDIYNYIVKSLNIKTDEIHNLYSLKEGVTNTSFHFSTKKGDYVCRVPGIGTDKQIDRKQEQKVYKEIMPLNITDEIVSFDGNSGLKITKFLHNTRIANPFDESDLALSMRQLKMIHDLKIKIDRYYDIETMIKNYYDIAKGVDCINYDDIEESNNKLLELYKIKKDLNIEEILCHGDFAHTNILMLPDGTGKIIDWEYAGMADPIMDVSMYGIYAELPFDKIEQSAKYYFGREMTNNEKIRLYLYISIGGYLWTMWSKYKESQGQEFGDYPDKMYKYFKDGYSKVMQLNEKEKQTPKESKDKTMKKLYVIILTILIISASASSVNAYLDPSVVTYIVQAVAGIAIAVGAGLGIYYHKTKKKVKKVLKINEEEKKEKEDELVVFSKKDKK